MSYYMEFCWSMLINQFMIFVGEERDRETSFWPTIVYKGNDLDVFRE